MRSKRSLVAFALLAGAAVTVRARGLGAPFFSDDYMFLDLVRARSLVAVLAAPDAIGNFFRPVGRALWFWVLARMGGESPTVFHVANLVLFTVALALLAALVHALAGRRAAAVSVAFLALSHAPDVAVRWASGAQDLLALTLALATLLLHRAGRRWPATACLVLALLSKETVAATPLLAVMLARRPGERWRDALMRAWPLFAGTAAWAAAWWATLPGRTASGATLTLTVASVPAAFAHLVQTALGLEWAPGGGRPAWPAPATLVALGIAALALAIAAGGSRAAAAPAGSDARTSGRRGASARAAASSRAKARPTRDVVVAGLAWALLGAVPVVLVAPIWSAYFYLFALGGVALALGALLADRPLVLVIGVVVALGGLAGGARSLDEFALVNDPWSTLSHVNPRYLDRSTQATRELLTQLRAARPRLAPGTTLFFAGLPAWGGMQLGGGPFVRWAYRDTSLTAHFLSQFSRALARGGDVVLAHLRAGRLEVTDATPENLAPLAISLLLDDAVDGARDAMRMDEERGGPRPEVDYGLLWVAFAAGDSADARRRMTRIGARADADAHAEIQAALAEVAARDTAAAMARMELAVLQHALDPRAHVLLAGLALANANTSLVGVLEAFAGRTLAPGWPPVWLRWSQAEYVSGRYARALDSIERYLQLAGPAASSDAGVLHYRDELRRRVSGGDLARAAVRKGLVH